jgi:WD40 repeat protein
MVNSLWMTSDDVLYSGSYDYSVTVWNTTTDSVIKTYDFSPFFLVARKVIIADGFLYTQGYYEVTKWNLATGSKVSTLGFRSYTSAGYYNDIFIKGGFLFTAVGDNVVRQYNTTTGNLIMSYIGHSDKVSSVTVGHDGYLYTGSYDLTVKKWEAFGLPVAAPVTSTTTMLATPSCV